MLGSEFLDVAIGLVFVYLSCSLVCSAINECFIRLLNVRSKDLENQLKDLLKNPELVEKIYNHPMVKGVTSKTFLDKLMNRTSVNHIDPKVFTTVLSDLVCTAETEDKDNIIAALEVLYKETGADKKVNNILKSIATVVKAEAKEFGDQIKEFQAKAETWFDDAMIQMSKLYKRRTRFIIFFIALPLCWIMNVDSIVIAENLYKDDDMRAQVVSAAENLADIQEKISPKNDNAADPKATDAMEALKKQITKAENEVKDMKANFEKLDIPIGWDNQTEIKRVKKYEGSTFYYWLFKILGILLTTIAVSMGAPFWIDLLKRMIGFRKTLKGKEN